MLTKRSDLETKYLGLDLEIKQISDSGTFEGYGSVAGNLDQGGDIVEPGAFSKSLANYKSHGKMPKMLHQHNPDKVIGIWEEMREDDRGLYVKGRLLTEIKLAEELHILMKAGAVDGMSIGYRIVKHDTDPDNRHITRLKELDLWEVSVVTFPMNREANVTGVKTHLDNKQQVERILREGGVAGQMAKLIAVHGFDEALKRVEGRREADDNAIENALKTLRDNINKSKDRYNA